MVKRDMLRIESDPFTHNIPIDIPRNNLSGTEIIWFRRKKLFEERISKKERNITHVT